MNDASVNKSPSGREVTSCLPWPTSWLSIPRGGGWVLFLSHIPSQSPGRQLHPCHPSGEKKNRRINLDLIIISFSLLLKTFNPYSRLFLKYSFNLLLSLFLFNLSLFHIPSPCRRHLLCLQCDLVSGHRLLHLPPGLFCLQLQTSMTSGMGSTKAVECHIDLRTMNTTEYVFNSKYEGKIWELLRCDFPYSEF